MKNSYNIIRQLIDLLDLYESESEHLNLLGFAEWMVNRLKSEPALNTKVSNKIITPE